MAGLAGVMNSPMPGEATMIRHSKTVHDVDLDSMASGFDPEAKEAAAEGARAGGQGTQGRQSEVRVLRELMQRAWAGQDSGGPSDDLMLGRHDRDSRSTKRGRFRGRLQIHHLPDALDRPPRVALEPAQRRAGPGRRAPPPTRARARRRRELERSRTWRGHEQSRRPPQFTAVPLGRGGVGRCGGRGPGDAQCGGH